MDISKLMQELNDLQAYLQSPQVEDDFHYGTEQERIDMLEIMEKLMDVGDLADEVATKLIFKGRMPINHTTH